MDFASRRIAFFVFALFLGSSVTAGRIASVGPADAGTVALLDNGMGGTTGPSIPSSSAGGGWNDVLRDRAAGAFAAGTNDTAYFAGGSFWTLEADFETHRGVRWATTGYASGDGPHEAVEVVFDPRIVSYDELLSLYWRRLESMQGEATACSADPAQRAVIFCHNDEQRDRAFASREKLVRKSGGDVPGSPSIEFVTQFDRAADDEQDVYRKHRDRYRAFLARCGEHPLAGDADE